MRKRVCIACIRFGWYVGIKRDDYNHDDDELKM